MLDNSNASYDQTSQLIHANNCLRSQIDILRQKYPKEHDKQYLLENPHNGSLDLLTQKPNGNAFYSVFSFFKIKSLLLLISPLKSDNDQILDFCFEHFSTREEHSIKITVEQFRKPGHFIQALLLDGIVFTAKVRDSQKEALIKGYALSNSKIEIANLPILPGWRFTEKNPKPLFVINPYNTIPEYLDGPIVQKKIICSSALLNDNHEENHSQRTLPTINENLTYLHLTFIASILQTLFNKSEGIYWDKIVNICVDNFSQTTDNFIKHFLCFYENPTKIPELPLSEKGLTSLIRSSKDEILLLKVNNQKKKPADIYQIERNLNLILTLNGTEISYSKGTFNTFIPVVLSTTPITGVSSDNIITISIDSNQLNNCYNTNYTIGDLVIHLTNYISENYDNILLMIRKIFETQYSSNLESYNACFLQMLAAYKISQEFINALKDDTNCDKNFSLVCDIQGWFKKQLATSDVSGIAEIFIEHFKNMYMYGVFKCINPYDKYPDEENCIPIIIDKKSIYFRRSVFQNKIAPEIFSDVLPVTILRCLADADILVLDSSTKRCFEIKKRLTTTDGTCKYERCIVLRKSAFTEIGEANIF